MTVVVLAMARYSPFGRVADRLAVELGGLVSGTTTVLLDGTVSVPAIQGVAVPALNVEFSDDEIAAVRAAARTAGQSMRAFAKQAILDRALDRAGRVRQLGIEIAQRSSELNSRLA